MDYQVPRTPECGDLRGRRNAVEAENATGNQPSFLYTIESRFSQVVGETASIGLVLVATA